MKIYFINIAQVDTVFTKPELKKNRIIGPFVDYKTACKVLELLPAKYTLFTETEARQQKYNQINEKAATRYLHGAWVNEEEQQKYYGQFIHEIEIPNPIGFGYEIPIQLATGWVDELNKIYNHIKLLGFTGKPIGQLAKKVYNVTEIGDELFTAHRNVFLGRLEEFELLLAKNNLVN